MGVEAFAEQAAAAGVDGVLLLDLPIEEAGAIRETLDAHGLDLIFLVSPTTSDARLADAVKLGRGFLYAISRLGVTGARNLVSTSAEPLVRRLQAATRLPVALGFGISTAAHVAEVGRFADAAVVGSALVEMMADADARGDDVGAAVEQFVRGLRGAVT
jgi:tryptophan synthase alpha chain